MSNQGQKTKPDGGASASTAMLGGTRFDSQEWLTEALQDGTPRHRRLSFLITANGGLRVGGWGIISFGGGHERGLEQNDAIELMQWSAFMDGLEAAGVEILAALRPYFETYQAEFVRPNEQGQRRP